MWDVAKYIHLPPESTFPSAFPSLVRSVQSNRDMERSKKETRITPREVFPDGTRVILAKDWTYLYMGTEPTPILTKGTQGTIVRSWSDGTYHVQVGTRMYTIPHKLLAKGQGSNEESVMSIMTECTRCHQRTETRSSEGFCLECLALIDMRLLKLYASHAPQADIAAEHERLRKPLPRHFATS
jgi:hypothetical protein